MKRLLLIFVFASTLANTSTQAMPDWLDKFLPGFAAATIILVPMGYYLHHTKYKKLLAHNIQLNTESNINKSQINEAKQTAENAKKKIEELEAKIRTNFDGFAKATVAEGEQEKKSREEQISLTEHKRKLQELKDESTKDLHAILEGIKSGLNAGKTTICFPRGEKFKINDEENDFDFLTHHGLRAFLNSDNDIQVKKVVGSRQSQQNKRPPTAAGIKKLLKGNAEQTNE